MPAIDIGNFDPPVGILRLAGLGFLVDINVRLSLGDVDIEPFDEARARPGDRAKSVHGRAACHLVGDPSFLWNGTVLYTL